MNNLTICPDCGGKVSKLAPFCPHCGRPLRLAPPDNVWTRKRGCADILIFGPLLLIALLLIIASFKTCK